MTHTILTARAPMMKQRPTSHQSRRLRFLRAPLPWILSVISVVSFAVSVTAGQSLATADEDRTTVQDNATAKPDATTTTQDRQILPMRVLATPLALSVLPLTGETLVFADVTCGQTANRSRLRAHYHEYQATALLVGGQWGLTLNRKAVQTIAVGGNFEVLSYLVEAVDVQPAIHERHQLAGLGNLQVYAQMQWFDSRTWGLGLKGLHLTAGAALRGTAPTTTLTMSKNRHPRIPWLAAFSDDARGGRAGLLEANLSTRASLWHGRLSALLSWTPMAWGIVRGAPDRFLTHLALELAGRPWQTAANSGDATIRSDFKPQAFELAVEVAGLFAYNHPRYTDDLVTGSVGLAARLWLGPLAVELGMRYGFGDTLVGFGTYVAGAAVTYRFGT